MADYVLIESRDPSDTDDVRTLSDLTQALLRRKNRVTVILLGEGVRLATTGEHTFWLASIRRRGAKIMVDAASLIARGVPADQLEPIVEVTPEGVPIDTLLEGKRPLWITDWVSHQAA